MTYKLCTVCGKQFAAYRSNNKYCTVACRKKVQAKQALKRYHRKKNNSENNVCNKCGEIIGKGKHTCDYCKSLACVACGTIRHYMRGSKTRTLCLKCYHKYRKYSNIEKVLKQIKRYEQMFESQQTQLEELLVKNKELKQQLDVARRMNENGSYDKNNNLYRKQFIANRKSQD